MAVKVEIFSTAGGIQKLIAQELQMMRNYLDDALLSFL